MFTRRRHGERGARWDGARGSFRAVLLVLAAGAVAGAGDVTEFVGPLRQHDERIARAHAEIEALPAGPDGEAARGKGRGLLEEARAFSKTLAAFQEAETRRGLDEEYDLIRSGLVHVDEATGALRRALGSPPPPVDAGESSRVRGELGDLAVALLKQRLAERFESEGLRAILTAESWDEALSTALDHGHRKVREFLDRETERLVGLRFHDGKSLRRALRERLRHEVRRHVAKLLVKITSNEIVVDFVADALIRWLGPKLKEALRNKGDLPERTARSLETLEEARRALNAFAGDARVPDVQGAVRRAEGAVAATRHLRGDLERAGKTDLLASLGAGIADLERTVSLTRRRFLLDKKDHEEDLAAARAALAEMIEDLERILAPATIPPAGRYVYHLFHPHRVGSELNVRLGGRPSPWALPRAELVPRLYRGDIEAHEKTREAYRRNGMPDPGPAPRYERLYDWHAVRATCAGVTAYAYWSEGARHDALRSLGRAFVFGLAPGRHAVSATVVTAGGYRHVETIEIEVAPKSSTPPSATRASADRAWAAFAAKPAASAGTFALLQQYFDALERHRRALADGGGTATDLLAVASEMVERSSLLGSTDAPRGWEGAARELRRLHHLATAAALLSEIGDTRALPLMARILRETPAPVDAPSSGGFLGEDSPETARNRAVAPIHLWAMHLAISASNDVSAARGHYENVIRASGRAHVEQMLPDLPRNFPPQIAVE